MNVMVHHEQRLQPFHLPKIILTRDPDKKSDSKCGLDKRANNVAIAPDRIKLGSVLTTSSINTFQTG